ncbi:MAG: hypothetical protein ABI369_01260 [Acetobacteraceae bacterium]
MAVNKVAAAYLAYFAYIDDALETVRASDFVPLLNAVPAGAANGPWTLAWGPAVNDGILCYVAQGADGTYGLAFRGTDTDTSITGAFENFLADLEAFNFVPWLYPQGQTPPLQLSAGTNQALALAVAVTDPATDLCLLDYLRSLASPLELMVTGHSLGGALAVAATAWLHDQLPKTGGVGASLWPHTFAAPTVWNQAFADWFGITFTYYAAVNGNDIVPMAWNNLAGIQATFPSPGPSLEDTNWLLYGAISAASALIPTYTSIAASNPDAFTATPVANETWTTEAGTMHSMQYQYFPHATGATAPPLPNTSTIGVARPRAAAP